MDAPQAPATIWSCTEVLIGHGPNGLLSRPYGTWYEKCPATPNEVRAFAYGAAGTHAAISEAPNSPPLQTACTRQD